MRRLTMRVPLSCWIVRPESERQLRLCGQRTPFGDVAVVLLQRVGEGMTPGAVCHEIQII